MSEVKLGIKITADGKIAVDDLKRIENALNGIGNAAGATAEEMQRATMAGAAIGSVIGNAGADAIRHLMGMATSALHAADAMNDLHLRTGESLRDLAAYDLMARQSGTSIDGVATGIRQLSRFMVEHGDKLASIGVTATDTNAAMRQFADVIAKTEDPALRTALAVEVLGRNGTQLLPLLVQGAAGFEEAATKTEAYGAAMERVAPLADTFNDQLAVGRIHAETLGLQITGAVLPALIHLNDYIGDAVGKTGEFNAVASTARTVMEAIAVTGVNVAYVFKAMGTEIGGIAAQLAALARGDFAGFKAIGVAMTEDAKAARAAVDALSERIASGTVVTQAATKADADHTRALEAKIRAMVAGGAAHKKAAAEESEFINQSMRLAKQAEKELADLQKERQKAEEEETKSREAALKAGEAYLTQIDARASAMEKEVENYGKTESAIELTTLARLKEARELAAANGAWPEHLAFLDREIAARERLASAAAQKEVLDANKKAAEDSARTWEKISGDINKNLFDAIFGGGKKAGDMLKDWFKTLVLAPAFSMATQPLSNAIGEAFGFNTAGTGGAGAIGGAGNLVSTGSGLYQAWQGYTTGTGTGMWGAAGNYLGGYGASGVGAGFAGSANYLTASQAAAQGLTYDAAAGGYLNAQGTIVANAAPSSGAGALGGAATAVGWLAVAYLVLDYISSMGGSIKTEGDSFATLGDKGATRGTTWVDGSGWYKDGDLPPQVANPEYERMGWEAAIAQGVSPYMNQPGKQAQNEIIAGALEPWTDGVRQMIADLGGDATGMRFGLGFNTDPGGSAPDNVSAGVADASGNEVYRSTHDVDKGTYGAALTLELQRMMVASIKAADVSPVYKSVVDSIDLMKASAEQLSQVMTDIATMKSVLEFGSVDPFQAYADSLEAVGQSLTAQLAKQRAAVTAAAAAYNGSTASINALAAATQQRYQMELALAKQLDDLVKSSSSMYAGGRREIEMAGLDARGKYDYYDAETRRYRDVLAALTTEADIQEYRDKLYQSTMAAFGTLDESQQAVHKTEFLARLDDQEKLVNDRIAAVKDNIKADNTQLQTDIATAIDKAMADAAAKIAAAASIPQTINVVSSINLTGGGILAEVGGWGGGG